MAALGGTGGEDTLRDEACRMLLALRRWMLAAAVTDATKPPEGVGYLGSALSVIVQLMLEAMRCESLWEEPRGGTYAFQKRLKALAAASELPNGKTLLEVRHECGYHGAFYLPSPGWVAAALLWMSIPENRDIFFTAWMSALHLLRDQPMPLCCEPEVCTRADAMPASSAARAHRRVELRPLARRQTVAVWDALFSAEGARKWVRICLGCLPQDGSFCCSWL